MSHIGPLTLSSEGGSRMSLRILLLEDDASDAELAERTLRRSGLDFTLCRTATRGVVCSGAGRV